MLYNETKKSVSKRHIYVVYSTLSQPLRKLLQTNIYSVDSTHGKRDRKSVSVSDFVWSSLNKTSVICEPHTHRTIARHARNAFYFISISLGSTLLKVGLNNLLNFFLIFV